MGRLQLQDMLEHADKKQALEWHLSANHFPPIHSDFVPVAEEAIERASHNDWDSIIHMPNGIDKTVGEIVDGLHLDDFVYVEEVEDEGL